VKKFNLADANPQADPADPEGFQTKMHRFGPDIGGSEIGASVYEIPPRQALCPYHFEISEEEWLMVISGAPHVRTPEGEEELAEGDIVCFTPGPEGAHQIHNPGDQPVRVMMFSTIKHPAVCIYPDSDKVGVFVKGGAENLMVKRHSDLDYFEGEKYPIE
jgi:uncharacterized cupin superfamily protein